MSTDEATVQIPSVPQPSSMAWLGAAAAAAGLSWTVTVTALMLNEPTIARMVTAGLCISVTVSVVAVLAWARYDLAKAAAARQRQLADLATGQQVLLIAEMRSLRRAVEESASRACIERQALGVKLTKVIDGQPGYWHGVADGVQRDVVNSVREIGPFRGPNR